MSNFLTRQITLSDFYRYAQVTDCAIAPDGAMAAFIQKTPLEGKNDYSHNLWITRTDGSTEPHALSRGQRWDRMPRWAPDGSAVAILSKRETDKPDSAPVEGKPEPEPMAQIWLYNLTWGGEPRQLTDRSEGVEGFAWSPDGSRIVFTARDPSEADAAYLQSIRDKKSPGPLVLSRVQHKTDEEGYLDNVPTHLFLLDVASGGLEQLTTGAASEVDPIWSPDGHWILFRSNRTGDADNNRRFDLWLVSPETREVRRLTFGDVEARYPVFSPDGSRVAFISSLQPENAYVLNRLWTVSVSRAKPVPAFPQDLGMGWTEIGGVVPDAYTGDPVANARVYPVPESSSPLELVAPGFEGLLEGPVQFDGPDAILAVASERAQSRLFRFDVAESSQQVIYPLGPSGTLTHFDAAQGQIIGLVNRPETGPECCAVRAEELIPLSRASSSWLAERSTAAFERIHYLNSDGQEIEALVLAPPDFVPEHPAPLIVSIHGGPMSYEAPEFEFETQYWANRGYMVLLVNYRGSTSYGEVFCQCIQGQWGPMEHDDVMCGIDALLAKGWVDPARLYCTGFSMGGIMTNWAVGHTDRFRAAVTEHGVWDYVSAFGTDDCHLWWQDDLGVPWQNREAYYASSPMSGLANIHTPLLITAGEHDWRCAPSQAEQLYVSLKKRGVDTELVIYPNEHHDSDTRPARALDRLRRIDAWFARYGGIPIE